MPDTPGSTGGTWEDYKDAFPAGKNITEGSSTMPDTLSREELDEIRGRDARAADDPHTWTVADRRALLAHIDTLTAALRETTEAFHALNWHDRPVFGRPGYTLAECPIERCRINRDLWQHR